MTAQTLPSATAPNPVRRILTLDALSCAAGGVAVLAGARPLAGFLGLEEALPLALVGGGLLGYAALLYWRARQEPAPTGLLRTVIIVNAVWVVASALLIVENPLALTNGGRWLIGIVAALVADLAIIQAVILRRQR
jgi:hypothetical protein